ncbi:Arabinose operon regulatory protein [Paenibacillus solanacearum]|uniref:Arabinose operon regulatory protein n=1 Tax=Paenibacillus solanacearum TaxID=2048548 RepID=A0A916NL69_9BACL|nr:helix-turn-helix domain-containing protein [Paenibacillus solanacearum]CAG7600566.1 Arabinose operon regulatory protein [Paenibacillus solanacearum]
MKQYNDPDDYNDYPVQGIIVAGHFAENDSYSVKRPEGIRDCLLALTLQGEGYFITDEGKRICRAGDVAIMRGDTPHQYGTCRGEVWNFVWTHFSPELLEPRFEFAEACAIVHIDNSYVLKRMYRAFKRIIADWQERRPYWQELCHQSLREILLLLKQRQSNPMDPRIEQTLHLLSTQMKRPFQIAELAREVGLSPSRLSHLFKETVGCSIIEALNRIRLDQAALLLEHTDRGATEVAEDVGFQSYNHFASLFRKRYGTNPRAFKSMASDKLAASQSGESSAQHTISTN